MPIKIPDGLPAEHTLSSENIFVMHEVRAAKQDIRPLQVAILNLMPTKVVTETQFARLLGNTPLQVELTLLQTATYESKNTSREHLLSFYNTFDEVKHRKFDGLVITGAPVEQIEFADVEYWHELCSIMEWSKSHVYSTMHICWGAQAALYYHYGVKKYPLEKKLFGVFSHNIEYKNSMLFRGFDDTFMAPHSRHTTVERGDIESVQELQILASSDEAGVYAIKTEKGKQFFVMGHSEYDADTLEKEYRRDKDAGLPIEVPRNYYPNDDDTLRPFVSWRSSANLMFMNWLNYFVYQNTPFELDAIGTGHEDDWLPQR